MRNAFADPFLLILHDLERILDPVRVFGNKRGDLLRRGRRLLSEFSYFFRYYGEASALLPGPRRFNSGVESEKIRLPGDAADHLNNLGNTLRAVIKRRDRLGYTLSAFVEDFHAANRNVKSLLAFHRRILHTLSRRRYVSDAFRNIVHCLGNPVDGLQRIIDDGILLDGIAGDLCDRLRRMLRSLRRLIRRSRQFLRRGRQLLGGFHRRCNQFFQPFCHGAKTIMKMPYLVLSVRWPQINREVPLRYLRRNIINLLDRSGNGLRRHKQEQAKNRQRNKRAENHHPFEMIDISKDLVLWHS